MSFLQSRSYGSFGCNMRLPSSYSSIRPHHVLILYGVARIFTSSTLYKRLAKKILALLSRSTDHLLPLIYSGFVPDVLIRLGIRIRLRDQLAQLQTANVEEDMERKMSIVEELRSMPVAIQTDAANEQHYEVPPAFYSLCLGPCKKYSSGLWLPSPLSSSSSSKFSISAFEQSETDMLDLYCTRADIQNGMKVVDLGCGWGSFTLHLAKKFPDVKITSISNSHSQREYILRTAKERGLNVDNINVITCNVADDKGALDVVKDNDRVVSIEMFEHMKNYSALLQKIHGFLKPNGKLFVHIFSHKAFTYHFEQGWMSDNFFTGGTMPSDDLLLYFAQHFTVTKHWRVNGTHYEKTNNGWLQIKDQSWNRGDLPPVLAEAYGVGKEREWYVNWRLFYMACAELFGLNHGNEWLVSHYLFERR